MLEHIVFMKLKPGVSGAQTADLMAALTGLKDRGVIPGILRVSGGYNTSPEGKSQGYDFAFVVSFVDAAARDAYLPHPEHKELARCHVRPICDDLVVFDFDSPTPARPSVPTEAPKAFVPSPLGHNP